MCLVCLLCALTLAAQSNQGDYHEIVRLLPKAIDGEPAQEIENRKRLLELGPAAYPSLIRHIKESENYIEVANAIKIIALSEGDKTGFVSAAPEILSIWSDDDAISGEIRFEMARALCGIRHPDSLEILQSLLADRSVFVRYWAVKGIVTLNLPEGYRILEDWLSKHRIESQPSAQQDDIAIREAEKALQQKPAAISKEPTRPRPQPDDVRPVPSDQEIATETKSNDSNTVLWISIGFLMIVVGAALYVKRRKNDPE